MVVAGGLRYRPLHIGPLIVDPPVLQAPMAGFTNYAFRQIVREFGGAGLQATEMVSACGFAWLEEHEAEHPDRLWGVKDEPRPLAVQIWDNDPDMLASAERKCAGVANCSAKLLGIEDCASLGEPFDAVLVLGNVLPGFHGPNVMEAALLEMHKALVPGGIFFTQNLNYDKRWREKIRTFPLLSGRDGEAEVILFKFADYGGGAIDFHANFIVREKPGEPWRLQTQTSRQRPVFQHDLENACRLSGFKRLERWGSYDGEPFDANKSPDLLLAAWK